jgi:hypothetical protein
MGERRSLGTGRIVPPGRIRWIKVKNQQHPAFRRVMEQFKSAQHPGDMLVSLRSATQGTIRPVFAYRQWRRTCILAARRGFGLTLWVPEGAGVSPRGDADHPL